MLGVHGQDVEFAAKTLLASNTHSRTNPRQPATASTFWIYGRLQKGGARCRNPFRTAGGDA